MFRLEYIGSNQELEPDWFDIRFEPGPDKSGLRGQLEFSRGTIPERNVFSGVKYQVVLEFTDERPELPEDTNDETVVFVTEANRFESKGEAWFEFENFTATTTNDDAVAKLALKFDELPEWLVDEDAATYLKGTITYDHERVLEYGYPKRVRNKRFASSRTTPGVQTQWTLHDTNTYRTFAFHEESDTLYVELSDSIVTVDGPTGEQTKFLDAAETLQALYNDVLYVSVGDCTHAIDVRSGETLWETEIAGPDAGTPEIGTVTARDGTGTSDVIFTVDGENCIRAVNASTGDLMGSFQAESRVRSPPLTVDETGYVGTWDGTLYAIDAASGDVTWQYDADNIIELTPRYYDGTILFPTRRSKMHCLDADTGDLLWTRNVDKRDLGFTIQGDTLYLSNKNKPFLAVDPTDGTERKRYPYTFDELEEFEEQLIFQPRPTAIDADDGRLLWKYDLPEVRQFAVGDNRTYLATKSSNIYNTKNALYALEPTDDVTWGFDGIVEQITDTTAEIALHSLTGTREGSVELPHDDLPYYAIHTAAELEVVVAVGTAEQVDEYGYADQDRIVTHTGTVTATDDDVTTFEFEPDGPHGRVSVPSSKFDAFHPGEEYELTIYLEYDPDCTPDDSKPDWIEQYRTYGE